MKYLQLASLIALVGVLILGCGTQEPAETPVQVTAPLFDVQNGTETLGDIGMALPPATGIVAAGVGMRGDPGVVQPGVININVPGTPVKAFLYWEGQMETQVSGDVGANETMIVSPTSWRERIAPLDARILEPGRERGLPLSLHSCGYCGVAVRRALCVERD